MSKLDQTTFWILFFIVIGIFALVPVLAIVNGYFLSIYWQWFISKPFGIRPLTTPEVMGIGLIISFLTSGISQNTDKKYGWRWVFALITKWIVTFIFAWVLHFYV